MPIPLRAFLALPLPPEAPPWLRTYHDRLVTTLDQLYAQAAAGVNAALPLAGGTETGPVTFAGPVSVTGAVTASGAVTLTGAATLTLAADPTAALQAATKQYVDARTPGTTFTTHTRTELGADVAIVANTLTTILTQALVMPAAGGPWRVLAWWSGMAVEGAASATWDWMVDDQQGATNLFADQETSLTAGFGGGFAGSGVSRNTYANGAAITMLLKTQSNAGGTVKAVATVGLAKTYLQTLIVKA